MISTIGLKPPSQWTGASQAWLQKLVDDVAPLAETWEYEHTSPKQNSLAQRVFEEGRGLLDALYDFYEDGEVGTVNGHL